MGADQNLDFAGSIASVLDWWRDAGVDVLVDDDPRDWLTAIDVAPAVAAPVAPPVAVTSSPAAASPAPPLAMPDTIEAFLAWRVGDASPEAAWTSAPIAASGPADAQVMMFVDCPDRDDQEALLSGAPGRLFDRMLAAIGLSRDQVHLAAVCNRRPATGRIAREIEAQLADVARHHIGLIAPKRLLLMGDAANRVVLGANGVRGGEILQEVNHRNGKAEAVASFHPRFLIEKPAAKAQAWRDLQLLMRGL